VIDNTSDEFYPENMSTEKSFIADEIIKKRKQRKSANAGILN